MDKKIKALDLFNEIEETRVFLRDGLKAKGYIAPNSLKSIAVTTLAHTQENKSTSTTPNITDEDNAPAAELLWLENYYKNDTLLNGTFQNSFYFLFNGENDRYTSAIGIPTELFTGNRVVYKNGVDITAASTEERKLTDEDFNITINGKKYAIVSIYFRNGLAEQDQWPDRYYGRFEETEYLPSFSGSSYASYALFNGLFTGAHGTYQRLRQAYLSKRSGIYITNGISGTPFQSGLSYLNLIYSEDNRFNFFINVPSTTSKNIISLYQSGSRITIPENIYLCGTGCKLSNGNSNLDCYNIFTGANTGKKTFSFYNCLDGTITTDNITKLIFYYALEQVKNIRLYGDFKNANSVATSSKDNVYIEKITNCTSLGIPRKNLEIGVIEDSNITIQLPTYVPDLQKVYIGSLYNSTLKLSIASGSVFPKEFYLPKGFQFGSTDNFYKSASFFSDEIALMLLNNIRDNDYNHPAIKIRKTHILRFEKLFIKLNETTEDYEFVEEGTEGAITLLEGFTNKNYTFSACGDFIED